MSIWQVVKRVTASATSGVGGVVEAVRTMFGGDPELRRQVLWLQTVTVAILYIGLSLSAANEGSFGDTLN